jgi:YbbR domain-containing protein
LRTRSLLERLFAHWPAKILSIAAAIVLFLFNRVGTLDERFFSVPLRVLHAPNYVPAAPYPRSVRVRVRGPEEEIWISEDAIEAVADFTEHDREGVFREPVEIQTQGNALDASLEIQIEPLEVTVQLEEKITKSLEVFPTLTGFPAQGYELTQYFLSPSSVEVEGPRSKVQNLRVVHTEEVDLTGRKESFTIRVRLVQPDPFVSFLGGDVVEFRGMIQESIVVKTFEDVDVVAFDLAAGLEIVGQLPTGTVRVQGTQAQLEALRPGQIRLLVDCSDITSRGRYSIPARPDVPRGILVLDFEPLDVSIDVESVTAEEGG